MNNIREYLKAEIDKLPDEKVKLLSYRLRLEEIEKEIAQMEREVEEYSKKREGEQNGE